MKLYVYCLIEGIDALKDPPIGISGAAVRLLKIENVAVLVSEYEADAVPVTRENAMNHAAVVRSVLDRTTPLPFRFGTVVTEQHLRSYVSTHKPALETNLELVRGCVEMSVKLISEVSNRKEVDHQKEKKGVGATFLTHKRQEILGGELRAAQAKEISAWLQERVSGLTRAEKVNVPPSERLFVTAAHLVERAKIMQYRKKIAEARKERPDLHFLLSGPWPPYSFANIALEFKTQFGVS